jgi:hypothetical protein
MSHRTTPDRWRGLADPPSAVEITILADRAVAPLGKRIVGGLLASVGSLCGRAGARGAKQLVLGLAAILVIAGIAAIFAGGGAKRTAGPSPSDRGAAGVAAAYGYPPQCLAVTILRNDPTYARADFDRDNSCGRFNGYATAIFHRVGGAWRPALEALSYACPVRSLPRSVQVQLGVCQ